MIVNSVISKDRMSYISLMRLDYLIEENLLIRDNISLGGLK